MRRIFGAARNLQRRLAGDDRQRCDARLLAEHAQLFLSGGTARIERRHQHFLALAVRQAIGDLGGRRRFAGALQADHQDADRRGGCRSIGAAVGAEHRDELVVDDLDDHLAGRHRAQHLGADGLGFDLLGEILDDIERDVGLEQGATNLAHRLRRRRFRSARRVVSACRGRRKGALSAIETSNRSLAGKPAVIKICYPGQVVSICSKHKSTRERHALPDVNPPASRSYPCAGRRLCCQGRRNGAGMGDGSGKVNRLGLYGP